MRDAGGGDVVDLPHQEVVPTAALLPRLPVERLHDYELSILLVSHKEIQQANTYHGIECVSVTWNRTWPDASPRRRSKDRQQRCLFPIAHSVPVPLPLPLSTLRLLPC